MTTIDKNQIQAAYLGEKQIYQIYNGKNEIIFQDCLIQEFTQATTTRIYPPEFAKAVSFYMHGGGGGGKGGFAGGWSLPELGQGGKAGAYKEVLNQSIKDTWRQHGISIQVGKGGRGKTPASENDNPDGLRGEWTGAYLLTPRNPTYASGGEGGTETYVEETFIKSGKQDLINKLIDLTAGGSDTGKTIAIPRTNNPQYTFRSARGGKLTYNPKRRTLTKDWGRAPTGGNNGLYGGGGSGGSLGEFSTPTSGGDGGDGWLVVIWMP